MSIREIADAWQGRPTFAVIDLDALAGNYQALRKFVGPDVKIMSVVKANAYGHGAVPVAETVLANGADFVAVATVDEGAMLRKAGIKQDILVLGPMGAAEKDRAVGMGMSIVMSDVPFAKGLARTVRMHQRTEPIKVHLKIDTGMHRFGVPPETVVDAAKLITSFPELKLEGLMTHFASADEEDASSVHEQVRVFDQCVADLAAAGIEVPIHHVCNSAATLRFPEYHKNMVRPGIAGYGIKPAPFIGLPEGMRQILSIHSRVSRVIPLAKGDSVSYGGTWTAQEPTRAALIPIGYADGYLRTLSNRSWMTISGERADVIGRVCMDQTMLHLPKGLPAETRQPVVVIGNGSDEMPDAPMLEDLAEVSGSIPHEFITTMAPRLPKLYMRHGKLVAVADLEGYRKI